MHTTIELVDLPLLGVGILGVVGLGYFTLSRLRLLNKSTVLFVKLAQDTNGQAFFDYTAALSTSASIARSLTARSYGRES
jgi:hypothetical protein